MWYSENLNPTFTTAIVINEVRERVDNHDAHISPNDTKEMDLTLNPNRFGTNVFTVSVVDNNTHAPTTNVGVSLYTTMLDMDMGTDSINLLPDGKGHFSADGDLSMSGHWQVRIQIRTSDNTLHEAKVDFITPF